VQFYDKSPAKISLRDERLLQWLTTWLEQQNKGRQIGWD